MITSSHRISNYETTYEELFTVDCLTCVIRGTTDFICRYLAAVIVQSTHSISLTVVEEIAKQEGVSPEELRPPLHYVIDTDALDSLFQPADGERIPATVKFTYNGYRVSIDETGDVDVTAHTSATEADKTVV